MNQTELKKRAGSRRGLQRMGETHMMGKTQPTPVCRGHSKAKVVILKSSVELISSGIRA